MFLYSYSRAWWLDARAGHRRTARDSAPIGSSSPAVELLHVQCDFSVVLTWHWFGLSPLPLNGLNWWIGDDGGKIARGGGDLFNIAYVILHSGYRKVRGV